MTAENIQDSGILSWPFSTGAQRFLLVLGAVTVSIQAALLITVPPATAYETSIVTAYPMSFWVAFGVALGTSITVFLGSAVTASRYWRHGLVLLFCTYGMYLFLPIAQRYKLYGRGQSDVLVHLGNVKTILATGEIPGTLIYPIEHLLLSALAMLGIPLDGTKYLLSFVFVVLFICSIGLLVRQLTGSGVQGLAFGLCAASPLIFGKYLLALLPSILSFMLFPLVMTALERYRVTRANRFVFLSLTFALTILFFHPVTTLLLVTLVLSTAAFDRFYERIHHVHIQHWWSKLAFILLPAAFTWYIGFGSVQNMIAEVAAAERTSAGASEINRVSEVVLSTEQIVVRFIQIYGTAFIYLLIAGLVCLVVLIRLYRRQDTYAESYLSFQFAIGFSVAAAFLSIYLVAYGPLRVSRYMLLIAMVLIAVSLHQSVSAAGRVRRVVLVLIGSAVVLAAILGAFSTYQPNKHMTHAEHEGAEFMIEHYDGNTEIRSYGLSDNMRQYVSGLGATDFGTEPFSREAGYTLAPRLGYATNDTAAQSFGRSYLVTQRYDTDFLTAEYFTDSQQETQFFYGETDITRMHHDPTVQKVYANGGFEGWYVPKAPNGSQ